jgi:hypothetical protein
MTSLCDSWILVTGQAIVLSENGVNSQLTNASLRRSRRGMIDYLFASYNALHAKSRSESPWYHIPSPTV